MKNSANYLIGLSGHALVVYDILLEGGFQIGGYFELEEKKDNPLGLKYFGKETSQLALDIIRQNEYFISIGENHLRQKIFNTIIKTTKKEPINAIHPAATIAGNVSFGIGVMVAAGCLINPFASIGNGVICNTGSIIEHECKIGAFAHIAPGAVLAGNVSVGERTFIGANSVIRQGVTIGKDIIIGAGAVVTKDLTESGVYVGSPAKKFERK